MDIIVLAEEDILLGFKSAGVKGFSPVDKNEAVRLFDEIKRGVYGLVSLLIISENVSNFLNEVIQEHQLKGDYPLIIEVPGLYGGSGKKESLLDAIKKSVGISV